MTRDEEKTLAVRIAHTLRLMRRIGGSEANKIAESKIESLAGVFARTMRTHFSQDELELAVASELSQFPSLAVEHTNSAQAREQKEAERRANPSKEDWAAMTPLEKLEAINRTNQREREQEAAKDAKIVGDIKSGMSAFERLAFANRWGVKPPTPPKPPTKDEVATYDAGRKLGVANQQAHDATKTDKGK